MAAEENYNIATVGNGKSNSHNLMLADRVESKLRFEIDKLQGVSGARLPDQDTLCKKYNVSKKTVRYAIEKLRKANLVNPVRGSGTFIIPKDLADKSALKHMVLFCQNINHPYIAAYVGCASQELRNQGYICNLISSANLSEDYSRLDSSNIDIDGVIIISSGYKQKDIKEFVDNFKANVVCIGELDDSLRGRQFYNQLIFDRTYAYYRATKHLIDSGHKRIVLTGWDFNADYGDIVSQGYRQALEEADIEFNPDWILNLPRVNYETYEIDVNYHESLGVKRFDIEKWKDNGSSPTALIHSTSSPEQYRDILHYYFFDHFEPKNTVAVTSRQRFMQGLSHICAGSFVCSADEQLLIKRAINILHQPSNSDIPVSREVFQFGELYQWQDNKWQKLEE